MSNKLSKFENDAVRLMRESEIGILSTMSDKFSGYPFGSFVTYTSSKDRTILFYFSDLAEHTKNLMQDSKSSLTIFKINEKDDNQNSSRLTLLGDLSLMDKKRSELIQDHYFNMLPESKSYSNMHDFNFYEFVPSQIRWIGGFGAIAWLKPESWHQLNIEWSGAEKNIINHMNEDHSEAITASLKAQYGLNCDKATMISLCIDGYYVVSNEKKYFISFDEPCLTRKSYKDMLVKQAKLYK